MPEELEKKYKDKKIKVETKKIQVKTPKKNNQMMMKTAMRMK
jgi:hypothetical protein